MTDLAVDYAWQHPDPAAIKAAGYSVVLRYLSPDPTKNLSGPEAAALHAQGLGIGLVWESTGTRALDGYQAGIADAQTAVAQAKALGYQGPLLTNIGDFAAAPGQIPAIDAYYQGWASVVAPAGFAPGGYGTGYIIDQLVVRGRTGIWWQNAMNDAGESGSVVSSNAHVYQRVTPTRPLAGSFDEDVLVKPVAWWGTAQPAPAPAPVVAASTPTQIGDNVQHLPITDGKSPGFSTDAAGQACIGVTLPAGMSKDNVVSPPVIDGASPYDGNPADPWEVPVATVDYATGSSNNIRVVVKGSPSHFYTGRVYFA